MFTIEQAFVCKFTRNELVELKNVGELKKFLAGKVTPGHRTKSSRS